MGESSLFLVNWLLTVLPLGFESPNFVSDKLTTNLSDFCVCQI